MKRLFLPKNKFARVTINIAFIAIWEESAGLLIEAIWKKTDEFGLFNQDSLSILFIEILFLILPVLSFTYWIWWGKKLNEKKIK